MNEHQVGRALFYSRNLTGKCGISGGKSLFCSHNSEDCFRQESSLNAKSRGIA